MDANEYSALALRTNSTRGHLNNLVHASLGMASEASELWDAQSPADLLEEVGDGLWFTNLLVTTMGWSFKDFTSSTRPFFADRPAGFAMRGAAFHAGVVCDLVKKAFAYGKSFDIEAMKTNVAGYLASLTDLLAPYGLTFDDAMAGNIAKLEVRYPDLRFNADHATNRNKDLELEAIEKCVASGN